jgi:hypothetical protein
MERMILQRDSLETLISKYEQANRRLEDLDQQFEELAKELAASPNGQDRPLTTAQQKKLADLAKQIAQQEQATRDAKDEKLPFDLDKALAKNLDAVANAMASAQAQTGAAATQPGMTTAGARKKLDEIRTQRSGTKRKYQQEATDPLDRLADIFPLQEDQARFEQLYEQQRDLEIRLSAMKGANGEDDPALKARMRTWKPNSVISARKPRPCSTTSRPTPPNFRKTRISISSRSRRRISPRPCVKAP